MKTAQEIAEFLGGTLHGNGAVAIRSVGSLDRAEAGALAYAEDKYLGRVASTRASCVLVSGGAFPDRTVIVTQNPRVAFARAAQWLLPRELPPAGVHPTAIIEPGAELGADVGLLLGAAVGTSDGADEGAALGIAIGLLQLGARGANLLE